ncbi:MAG TPA: hypothetical protein VK524_17015 [Polyangiaceae bacterium]|nr:hypothetical protein [Polyangiaceae bacterium]
MKRRWLGFTCLTLYCAGCTESDFEPVSKISSVRVLAAQANRPYAKPDDDILLKLLVDDGRIAPPAADPDAGSSDASTLKYYWLKAPCINPFGDLYYACYPGFSLTFQPGEELHPARSNPDKFIVDADLAFRLPGDIISSHPPVEGSAPFGAAFAFAMACDGDHIRYLGIRTSPSPQSPPFGCFDSAGTQLGAEHFVFAFARVYAFQERVNTNPSIERFRFNDQALDRSQLDCYTHAPDPGAADGGSADAGADCPAFTVARCTKSDTDDCPKVDVDVRVPEQSQESDSTSDRGREQVWVNYYATGGKFDQEARILYDVNEGRLSDTPAEFRTPRVAGTHKIWAVVHDNRGGVEWVQANLIVQ